MTPYKPLLSFDIDLSSSSNALPSSPTIDDPETQKKRWYHYIPLCGTVFLMLAPHPSLLYVLVDFHLQTLDRPLTFAIHLAVTYTLSFLAFSSLIVCVARDPGPVTRFQPEFDRDDNDDDVQIDLTQALMPDIDFSEPGKWCRKCWAPKPERTHHCSACGRCVLKMDHHCPWLGSICIGHRTYPAFVHFLCCITIFAAYIAVISINALIYAFGHPYDVREVTPVHELFLAGMGIIFAAIIGSFFGYHVYLALTNQTTLENISPFFLLKHLPRLPPSGHSLSEPPLEPELSYEQRSLVKDAHGYVRLYDIGWRKNLAQTFGCRKSEWIYRLWCGGASPGDGKTFPRNPKADRVLTRLADELVKADKNT